VLKLAKILRREFCVDPGSLRSGARSEHEHAREGNANPKWNFSY
jgi:hypothetical protein